MWKCKHCSERLEDDFDSCWSCGYSRDGIAPDTSAQEEMKANEKELVYQDVSSTNPPVKRQEVVVVDLSLPFVSMVVFMVKWAIASIPAFLILFALGIVLGRLFGA